MEDLISREKAIEALLKEFERDTPKAIRAKLTLENLPSAQPETHDKRTETHSCDCISRQTAIDALMPIYKSASLRNRNVFSTARKCMSAIEELPPTQPDLSEYSDKLWKKAYKRGKAEALDEIVRCKDCRFYKSDGCFFSTAETSDDGFCYWAERRTDEQDSE